MNKNKVFFVSAIILVLVLILVFGFFTYKTPIQQSTTTNKKESAISYLEAAKKDGEIVSVYGQIKYVFNNGKDLLLGFNEPHAGYFKIIIKKENWDNFSKDFGSEIGRNKEIMYKEGDSVTATGKIQWYQGDPVIYVSEPSQISINPIN